MQGKVMLVRTVAAAGLVLLAAAVQPVLAAEKTITLHAISATGIGAEIGTVTARDTAQGLMLIPDLRQLSPPGPHGFHVHDKPDCGPGPGADGRPAAGMAAGGHYDPRKAGAHRGPHDRSSHLGDLPPLVVNENGTATLPVLAPRLKVSNLTGRAIMVHAGGDNYSDQPAPLGGGGARIACGVIR